MANWLLRLVWLRLNIVYNFAEVKTADAPRLFSPMQQNLGAANVAVTPLKKAAIAWTVDHCAIALGRRHDHTI
jgi:hypothetical protein